MDKAKLIKKSNTLVSRITVITLTFMMLVTGMQFSVMSPLVADAKSYDENNITTWDELKEAIQGGESEVTITKDLYATETIDITSEVRIKGNDGQTIYQSPRGDGEKYQTMFNVTYGGELTLGDNLTLSGKTCTGGGGSENKTVTFKIVGGEHDGRFLRVNNDDILTHYTEAYATEFELDPQGYLLYNGNYIGVGSGNVFECSSAISKDKAVQLMKNGESFVLEGNVNTTDEYGLGYANSSSQWMFADYNDGAYGFIENPSYASATNGHFKAVSIKDGSGGGGQGCDDECGLYTTENFDGGTDMDNPKGFFVHVDGGKATLDGATLTNFITSRDKDTTPKYVAPVAAIGGSFDIKSGEITNNIVGYVVNDDKANENANAIKMHVKGAAPNAQRTSGSMRRGAMAGIDDGNAGSGITATAGAVIYVGGATGTVSGGSISFNRGDTGGIMASGNGTKVTLADGTDINNNVGVQFGGGTTTEDGAFIAMTGGSITENVAWFGGGAVFATENGVKWLLGKKGIGDRETGWFTMDGGTIDGNTSFTRGGAILADSDGVSLIKGTLKDNMSRMLGGAIYVMGDHPDFTYTVYIAKGYVHDNKAVSAGYKGTNPQNPDASIDKESNLKLSQKLNAPDGCNKVGELFTGYMSVNSDDTSDGYPGDQKYSTDGTGGGIWLCSYGNTTIDLSNDSEFYVSENTATGSVRHQPISAPGKGGDDFHKDTKNNGSLVITGISDDDEWYDQNSGEKYTSPDGDTNSVTDTGMRNLINKGGDKPAGYDPDSYEGVDFYGNLSRRGGALAADGSFVFGKAQDLAELFAEMSIKKAWKEGTTPKDIVLKVFVETANDKVEIAEVPLSQNGSESSELDVVFDEGGYEGRMMLPAFVEKRNDKDEIVDMIPVFDIKVDGKIIDLNSVKDLTLLAEAIEDDESRVEFSSEGRKITFEEYVRKGEELVKTDEFQLSPAKVSLDELDARVKTIKQKQTSGDETKVVTASFSELFFNADISNDRPAEIEKFVNEAVHKPISLDEVFTYDIVAYVKQDADKLVITDTLVDDLEFVSKATDVKLYDLGKENNHKITNNIVGAKVNDDASVSGGTEIENVTVEKKGQVLKKVDINGQTLTVTIANLLELDGEGNYQKNADEDQYLTPLRGRWVRVSFDAQIKKDYQDMINAGKMTLADLKNVTIKADKIFKPDNSIYGPDENRPTPNVGNDPLKKDDDGTPVGDNHSGIDNTSSYLVEVANEPTYKDESNTVTVKPEEPSLEKYVNQAVHKNIKVDEVFTYDIIGYITKDADKVVFEDNLVNCLELVNVDKIKLESLDDDNHKPTYDIEGTEIHDDASVAETGEDIKSSDGVTIDAEEGGSTLKVTIDDGVTETGREYHTVEGLRCKYVKVTFQAQIKEELQAKIKFGEMTIDELLADKACVASVTDNDPVLSDESHDGIKNDATLKIDVGNEGKYELDSNVVTVKPEQPEIEKYVNQAVHKYIDLEEVFTYDIIAYITNDADEVEITDELDSQLQFVSKDSEVKVVDLGTKDNHKVTNDISAKQVNKDASVAEKGKDIEKKTVSISGNKLTVTLDDADTVKTLRGHWVKITFDSKIKDGLTENDLKFTQIDANEVEDRAEPNVGNAPVVSKESHDGVPNKAAYTIFVDNGAQKEEKYKDESNTVTVKPEKPTLEKYVHQAVHKNINLYEVFTYDIIGYITSDADKAVFEDQLVDDLEFVDKDDIKVTFLKDNNHKPFNDVAGTAIKGNEDASVASGDWKDVPKAGLTVTATDAGKLTVTIDDEVNEDARKYNTVKDLRGKYVKVTFKAQIKQSLQDEIKKGTKTLDDLSSVSVKGDENGTVLSDEAHSGIKNDATLKIYVGNEDKYDLESNVVTVKPEQPEIEKYVNQAVHDYIEIDETFTYDIIAYITNDADEVTITDELDSQLQFVSEDSDVKVVDLGTTDNHKVTNNINAKQVNKDASVAEEGTAIDTKDVSIEDNLLTVKLDDEKTVKALRGHWVKVTFDAKIKDGLTANDLEFTQIDAKAVEDRDGPNVGNDPVISDESHDGVPNKASYTIGVKNGAEIEEKHNDESNTVTVKPGEFDLEVSKLDLNGNPVPGAKLAVLASSGVEVESWTTTDEPHKLKLKPGNYTLREVSAPAGLKRITTSIKFTVNSDGTVDLKTTSVDNDGKVSISDNQIVLENAPVEPNPEKYIGDEKKEQRLKSKDEIVEFCIVATVPYGVSKFELTDPIPEPLLYVEDSLQIFIDDEMIDETSSVIATEGSNYVAIEITSDDDGTIDVSELYGKNVAIVFDCKLDPKADLKKYGDVTNTAYVFLNGSEEPIATGPDDQATVLGIYDLADDGGNGKNKGANTGDNAPIELALFGILASAAVIAIIRRRRTN